VISFLIQSAGAAMLAEAKGDKQKNLLRQHVHIKKLDGQLVAFGFFTAVAVRFHLKMRDCAADTNVSQRPSKGMALAAFLPLCQLHVDHAEFNVHIHLDQR
jgi:hypothetical protein